MFRLRTNDGIIHDKPTLEAVKQLKDSGRGPQWFVAKTWLQREFGERETATAKPSSQSEAGTDTNKHTDQLRRAHSAHIESLEAQLQASIEREKRTAAQADKDKERFASAAIKLARVTQKIPEIVAVAKQNEQLQKENLLLKASNERGFFSKLFRRQ